MLNLSVANCVIAARQFFGLCRITLAISAVEFPFNDGSTVVPSDIRYFDRNTRSKCFIDVRHIIAGKSVHAPCAYFMRRNLCHLGVEWLGRERNSFGRGKFPRSLVTYVLKRSDEKSAERCDRVSPWNKSKRKESTWFSASFDIGISQSSWQMSSSGITGCTGGGGN